MEGTADGEIGGDGLLRMHPALMERHNMQMSAETTDGLMIIFMTLFLVT
jgi:hypothetical protein